MLSKVRRYSQQYLLILLSLVAERKPSLKVVRWRSETKVLHLPDAS